MDGSGGERKRRRRNRWGDAPPEATVATTATAATKESVEKEEKPATAVVDARAKALALQASIKARLAALKASKAAGVKRPPPPSSSSQQQQPVVKKAKHYELDMTSIPGRPKKTAPALPAKPKINPYLAHHEKGAKDGDDDNEEIADNRLERSSKKRQRNRTMHFVEPGTFVALAERKRKKATNAMESGFLSGRKSGNFVQSAGIADIYGKGGGGGADDEDDDGKKKGLGNRADCGPAEKMPLVMEWWDMELLPSKLKKQVGFQETKSLTLQTRARLQKIGKLKGDDGEQAMRNLHESKDVQELRSVCFQKASLTYSKTSGLVQHLVPIRPFQKEEPREATLYLTKRELKRQRKLKRAEKQREQQDLQAAGLIPAPEPKLTLQNFIRVLGDQAYLDPTQMEQKVVEQVEARKRAHLERNAANKLTKEQRAEKRARKLHEDTTRGVSVALFCVKDMSHPYHRAKVDLNAQQNSITGGVLECQNPPLSCVICEGGPKAIKRYTRLMLVRMKWKGLDDDEEEEEEEEETNDGDDETKQTHKFNAKNECSLVWSGMGAKRLFKGFVFQTCETSDVARKVLANKGVGHYWDQVLTHASGRGDSFHFKLANDDDDDDDDQEEIDVEMEEA